MSLENYAAWVDGRGEGFRVGAAGLSKPNGEEILVKNHAVAVNPIDGLRQALGVFVQQWPAVFGNDLAGEVIGVGDGVTDTKPGTRVMAQALGFVNGKSEQSSFQHYTIVQRALTCPLPDSITYEEAAVIPLAFSTAGAGLYPDDFLGVPLPTLNPSKTSKTLLVWSGTSSVGSAAIQLAVASGLDVIATASPKHFDHCKALGAKDVLDYAGDDVVGQLTKLLQDVEVVGAFDAYGKEESSREIAQALSQVGGGFIASVLPPPEGLPENVSARQVFASTFACTDLGRTLWQDFLPSALAAGRYKPAPNPEVVGEGLASFRKGLDRLRQGVSARKIVVRL